MWVAGWDCFLIGAAKRLSTGRAVGNST